MKFRDTVCSHLSKYRQDVLGIEAGHFLYRGRHIQKGHILPRERFRDNVMEPYRDRFFASEFGGIKLHKFFHHLNSSQALCINLLFPLLAEQRHDVLIRSLSLGIKPPVLLKFESESVLEVAKRRTSFDFHLKTEDRDIFVEVKYTEDGFGGTTKDVEHRTKFEETYSPLLNGSTLLAPACTDCDFFLDNYQVLRNLVHITGKSEVVFLFPRANTAVAEQATRAREMFLTEPGRQRLHIVFLEDLVSLLTDAFRGHELHGYYQRFTDKYLAYSN